MSTSSEAPESSSHARQEQSEDPDDQPTPWVALSRVAIILGANDERDALLLSPGPGGAADLLLDLAPPPRASYLVLPKRIAAGSEAHIVAACSSHLLFAATRDDPTGFDFFLGDAQARTVSLLPMVPFPLHYDHNIDLVPRPSIGLVADPGHAGHNMIFQLHPTFAKRHHTLLCYSSATRRWTTKALASAPYHEPWGANGVLAHDGLLWWIDVAYGMLVCDPFADSPDLRFVPLPPGCQMAPGHRGTNTMLDDKRRFIRPSQGKLRYVQIRGLSYDMFTLVNPEGPADRWRREYTVNFANILGFPRYTAAGLMMGQVPSLALVHPNDADIVCFFHETSLVGVDGRAMRVIGCQEFLVDYTHRYRDLQCSGFIDAWELAPTLLRDHTSSDDGSGGEGPDDNEVKLGAATASDDEELSSSLSQMEINSQPDQAEHGGGHGTAI